MADGRRAARAEANDTPQGITNSTAFVDVTELSRAALSIREHERDRRWVHRLAVCEHVAEIEDHVPIAHVFDGHGKRSFLVACPQVLSGEVSQAPRPTPAAR